MSDSNHNRLAGTGRRKLGNVSNTPCAQALGGVYGKTFHQLKKDTFVKPSSMELTGGESVKKNVSSSSHAFSTLYDSDPKLATVYEDIENCYPIPPKEFSDECHPPCSVGLYEFDYDQICSMPFDESDEVAQKENRIEPELTLEELCNLF